MAQITCKNLALGYEGKTIVKNLSFSVSEGDYLCVLGENGSGKSTLIKALVHLIEPIEGEISEEDGFHHNEIGYLPQQSDVQKDFPASVFEIVLSGFLGDGKHLFYSRSQKQKAMENLQKLGMEKLSKKSYSELSGGQKQRVMLARALCSAKKMLILDEPVSGLDPSASIEMYRIVEELNRKDRITIIMISHDIPSALEYASHILYIGKSESFFGTKDEYLEFEAACLEKRKEELK